MSRSRMRCPQESVPEAQRRQDASASQRNQRHSHRSKRQSSRHSGERDRVTDTATSDSNSDRSTTYYSDVRTMTRARARELLTTYLIIRLEKNGAAVEEDHLGVVEPWEKVKVVKEDSLHQDAIKRSLLAAGGKHNTTLQARKAKYLPALQTQIEKATKNLKRDEKDGRFDWRLVQFEDQLKPLDKSEKERWEKEKTKAKDRAKEKKKRPPVADDDVSITSKKTTKHWSERVAVTLYYERFPKDDQDHIALWNKLNPRGRQSPPRYDMSPSHTPVPHDEATQYWSDDEYVPPVPNGTRPAPAARPHRQPAYGAIPEQQTHNVYYTQQRPPPQEAARPAQRYTDPGVQPPQAHQSSYLYTDPGVQPSRAAPPPYEVYPDPTSQAPRGAQASHLYTDPTAQAPWVGEPSNLHTYSESQPPPQATHASRVYTDPRAQPPPQTTYPSQIYTEPRAQPPPQTTHPSQAYTEARAPPPAQADRPYQAYTDARAQPPPQAARSSQAYADARAQPPPQAAQPSQAYAEPGVRVPQASQPNPFYMRPRAQASQTFQQPQQAHQPAVPQRPADVPPPPPRVPSRQAEYREHDGNAYVTPGIQVVRDHNGGEGPSHQHGARHRTHHAPESTQSTVSFEEYEDVLFSDANISAESVSQYTFATASPKPRHGRPRSRSPDALRPADMRASSGMAGAAGDYRGPNQYDRRSPSPRFGRAGRRHDSPAWPQAEGAASPTTPRAAAYPNPFDPQPPIVDFGAAGRRHRSPARAPPRADRTAASPATPQAAPYANNPFDPQRGARAGGENWSQQAQMSPGRDDDHPSLYYTESDEFSESDEPRTPRRQSTWRSERRGHNSGRESEGRGETRYAQHRSVPGRHR